MHRPILSACAVTVMLSAGACTIDQRETAPTEAAIELLTWTEQMAVRDVWLTKRHDMLLPMMRRHGIGMWIVVNEEFHDDPLTQYVAPARPYTGRRDIFVFVDAGDAGLRKVAATGYWEETVARFFADRSQTRRRSASRALRAVQARDGRARDRRRSRHDAQPYARLLPFPDGCHG